MSQESSSEQVKDYSIPKSSKELECYLDGINVERLRKYMLDSKRIFKCKSYPYHELPKSTFIRVDKEDNYLLWSYSRKNKVERLKIDPELNEVDAIIKVMRTRFRCQSCLDWYGKEDMSGVFCIRCASFALYEVEGNCSVCLEEYGSFPLFKTSCCGNHLHYKCCAEIAFRLYERDGYEEHDFNCPLCRGEQDIFRNIIRR